MPSGPKKRRAAKKKNDTNTSSTNTTEEKLVAAVELSETISNVSEIDSLENDQSVQTSLESPLMVNLVGSNGSKDSESVYNQIISEEPLMPKSVESSSKKTERNDVQDEFASNENVEILPKEAQDSSKEPFLEMEQPLTVDLMETVVSSKEKVSESEFVDPLILDVSLMVESIEVSPKITEISLDPLKMVKPDEVHFKRNVEIFPKEAQDYSKEPVFEEPTVDLMETVVTREDVPVLVLDLVENKEKESESESVDPLAEISPKKTASSLIPLKMLKPDEFVFNGNLKIFPQEAQGSFKKPFLEMEQPLTDDLMETVVTSEDVPLLDLVEAKEKEFESDFVDPLNLEVPLMLKSVEISPKKSETQDSLTGPQEGCVHDPPAIGHLVANENVELPLAEVRIDHFDGDRNELIALAKTSLEELLRLSIEMSSEAEKRMYLATEMSLNISHVLEKLKAGKLI